MEKKFIKSIFFIIILILYPAYPSNFNTEGGNISVVNVSSNDTAKKWAGLYGEVINSGLSNAITINPENISKIDLDYNLPSNCIVKELHIIAYNQSISSPLKKGNFTILDGIINSSENASVTFTNNESVNTSYGGVNNVPYTYTLSNNSSNMFKTYYLNDQNNGLVFLANVVSDGPSWNGSTTDYQLLLPSVDMNFTIDVDTILSCIGNENKKHEIYIFPINKITIKLNQNKKVNATIKNKGDYNERDIDVFLIPPNGSYDLLDTINLIEMGEAVDFEFEIHGLNIGTHIYKIKASNKKAKYEREFVVEVIGECEEDSDCGSGESCNQGVCEREYCISSLECNDNEICKEGSCVELSCDCGYPSGHECISYECCSDIDCEENQVCYENKCEELRPNLEYNETVPGEEVTITVTDPFGNPWVGSIIIDGVEYRLKDGKIKIPYPKERVAYVTKGNKRYGFILALKDIAVIKMPEKVYVNEKVSGEVLDELGRDIGKTKLIITKEGEVIKQIYTDESSKFYFILEIPGKYTIIGESDNYHIKPKDFEAIIKECHFPLGLGFIKLQEGEINYLWIIGIIAAIIMVIIGKNKFSYYILSISPLALSLPNSGVFSICFMLNIEIILLIGIATFSISNKLRFKRRKGKY